MASCNIGLIGLAVMGENLVLNMESKGFSVAVFNRTTSVTQKLVETRAKGKNITPAYTLEEFVQSLESPRKMMIMVKAGAPVDAVISQLVPLLDNVAVARPDGRGRPRKRLDHLMADKAYGSKANRRSLRARRIPHTVPERGDVRDSPGRERIWR